MSDSMMFGLCLLAGVVGGVAVLVRGVTNANGRLYSDQTVNQRLWSSIVMPMNEDRNGRMPARLK